MFSPQTLLEISRHAAAEYPRESCGFVVRGAYVPCTNVAPDPLKSYEVDRAVYEKYEEELQAIVHSHPDGPEYPSIEDMRSALASGVPNGIVCVYKKDADNPPRCSRPFFWGEGVVRPPLLGRTFRHGVTDCYALIRDWYKETEKIDLPEFPREWMWWKTGGDMYRLLSANAGFRQFRGGDKPRKGDVFLASIMSKGVVNHAGIYLGNDLIVHHPTDGGGYGPNSLSGRVSASRYVNSSIFCGWLRYDPLPDSQESPS